MTLGKSAINLASDEQTERQNLNYQNTCLRNAQHIAGLGSWNINLDNKSITFSEETCRIFDINPDDLHDIKQINERIHPQDRRVTTQERTRCQNQNKPLSIEYRVVHRDGSEHTIFERADTIYDKNGKPSSLCSTVEEVTARKQIEEELVKYRARLQDNFDAQATDLIEARDAALAAERAMSAFVANMSHEIRTPLHGILSFARFGIKKVATSNKEKLALYFEEIKDSGENLLSLLNNLLDLSKLKAGKLVYDIETCDLVMLAKNTLSEFRTLKEEQQLQILLTHSKPSIAIDADPDKIKQIIRNLLSNAVKFSQAHSTIQIQVELQNNNQAIVSVIDEGPGIPPGELDVIFQPFTQSSMTNTHAGGTGLGLAICKEIIELGHNGRITARNNEHSQGATFQFSLPTIT